MRRRGDAERERSDETEDFHDFVLVAAERGAYFSVDLLILERKR